MIPISTLPTPGALAWDSLPLIKLTQAPFAQNHSLPFAQARLAAIENLELRARLWAFEVGAPEDSRLGILLTDGKTALSATIAPGAPAVPFLREASDWTPAPALPTTPLSGEDLQGEFWGAEISFPAPLLQRAFPGFVLTPGAQLACFLWKGLSGLPQNFGCAFWQPDSLVKCALPGQQIPAVSPEPALLVEY